MKHCIWPNGGFRTRAEGLQCVNRSDIVILMSDFNAYLLTVNIRLEIVSFKRNSDEGQESLMVVNYQTQSIVP